MNGHVCGQWRAVVLGALASLAGFGTAQAAAVVRTGSGATPAALQAIVDQFRADLGGSNNGVGGSFASGRREINWDGVPNNTAAPNFMPPDFFNVMSPRGAVFHTVLEEGSAFDDFIVSASAASGTAVRFGNINAAYANTFITFSAERLFAARNAVGTQVQFYQPGTTNRAAVSGFGVVFSDVDANT